MKKRTANKLLKYFVIGGVISAIVILTLISTGKITCRDLIQIHQKLIEICPFCM